MAPAAAAGEDLLEVRCAGCGETLEVDRGLTEFICPDCSMAQALPPELMPPPPPPRRRRALPIPSAGPRNPAPVAAAVAPPAARLPCGACGSLLSVPPGLARCGCPICGAELAVDAARLRQYLLSTAAAPLVPVSMPPVFQAREVQQRYYDSAFRVGHSRGDLNDRPVHVERSQVRCQNTQPLLEYPDTDRDHSDTEMLNDINVTHSHRSGFSVDARTVGPKTRQVEPLNRVIYQAHAQQSNISVHAECPDRTVHAEKAQNESLNHAVHRGVSHLELIKDKTVVRHSNRITGTPVGRKTVNVDKSQIHALNQMTGHVQKQPSCNITCAEHIAVPYADQVIDLQETQIDPVSLRADAHGQQNNSISTRDSRHRTGYLVRLKAVTAKKRQEVDRATEQVSEQQPSDYATQVHDEPPNDGVGTGAEPSASRNKKKCARPTEQLVSEEREHTPASDEIQTENIEGCMGNQALGQAQKWNKKKSKKRMIVASNIRQQLRRSKRLAPEPDAVVDNGCLQIEPPEQHGTSAYQNPSDLSYIDKIVADICHGSSPQHGMSQASSENFHLATSPASNPYLGSHDGAIIEHDMQKTRSEAETHVVYKDQYKTGPPKPPIPVERELEHLGNNTQTELDEIDMTPETVRLTPGNTKGGFSSSSYEGFEHRRSKRLARQSTPVSYYESAGDDSEEHQVASRSQSSSDSPDIDQGNDDISSSLLLRNDMPERSSNEVDNLHVTTQSTISIPDMSDPESFARYYCKIYPPVVRRALERSPNFWLERVMHQNPSRNLDAGGQEKKRRGRGRTICIKVWNMPEGVRVPLSLNDLGEPIGNKAAAFGSFLTTLARDGTLAPLTYASWKRFPEKNKVAMWHIINLKFDIAPIGKVWALKALGIRWKNWKAILKRERYDSHETDTERLADRDPNVSEEQWKLLVAYWGTEEAKAASARSRASQAHKKPFRRHRSGTKSFARIREEERQKRPDKQEPSSIDMFILTHTPKDGKGGPADKATADIISRLREEARKQGEGSASGDMDDVLAKVIGERRKKKAAKLSLRQVMEAKRKAEEEAATLREKMLEMEENNRKLQEDLANANSPASSGSSRRM
ncbi:hypothetical protein ACP4OV_007085 [Aristida adscensionis]